MPLKWLHKLTVNACENLIWRIYVHVFSFTSYGVAEELPVSRDLNFTLQVEGSNDRQMHGEQTKKCTKPVDELFKYCWTLDNKYFLVSTSPHSGLRSTQRKTHFINYSLQITNCDWKFEICSAKYFEIGIKMIRKIRGQTYFRDTDELKASMGNMSNVALRD